MGQPPQRGHFTSRVSVSIIVAAPESWAPWIDTIRNRRWFLLDTDALQRLPVLRFRVFVLALRDAGNFALGRLPVADDPVARVARAASLTLARSRRFALFAEPLAFDP
jgi:hypothetical protein